MASGNIYHGGVNFSGTEVTVTPNSENQSVELASYTLDGVSGSIKMPGYITALIPKMTGYTTPSGTVIESSHYSVGSHEGYHAFDQVKGGDYVNSWLAYNTDASPYLIYKFTSIQRLSKLWIETYNNSTSVTKTMYVQGATDPECTKWENCLRNGDSTTITANSFQYFEQTYLLNNKKYYAIKISGDSVWMVVNGPVICITRMQVYDIAFGNEVADSNWNRNLLGTSVPDSSLGNDKDQYFKVQISDTPMVFTHLQLKITAVKGSDSATQIGEVELYDSTSTKYSWTGTTVTTNVGCYSGYGPEKLINGSYASMVDEMSAIIVPTAANPLIITFTLGTPITTDSITTWKWYTAADAVFRDPISFTLSGSPDGTTWYELDSVTSASVTDTRSTLAYTGNLTPQYIHSFSVKKVYLKNNGIWEEYSNGGSGGASSLSELNDVTISSPNDGDELVYDSENDEWVNGQPKVYNKNFVSTSDPSSSTGNDHDVYYKTILVPTPVTHDYIKLKLTITADRNTDGYTQLSRVDLIKSDDTLYSWSGSSVTANVAYPNTEHPNNLIDGNVLTKFCGYGGTSLATNPVILTFNLGTPISPSLLKQWKWYTANDSDGRDPITFTLSGSPDGSTWEDLDAAVGATITTNRNALAYTGTISVEPSDVLTIRNRYVKIDGEWVEDGAGGGGGTDLDLSIVDGAIQSTYGEDGEEEQEDILKDETGVQIAQLLDDISEEILALGSPEVYAPVVYSDEEREIGVWRDGKPLYQKTIDCGLLPNDTNWHDTAHNISDLEKVVNLESIVVSKIESNDQEFPGNVFRPTTNTGIVTIRYNQNIRFINNWQTANTGRLYVTIRYTKTTDIPGSGKYTALGTPAVHYSTNEQVIGTWIDGKTLYQKTFDVSPLPNSTDKRVPHGITNIGVIVNAFGYATAPGVNSTPIPFTNTTNVSAQVGLITDGTDLIIRTGDNRSAYTIAYVTLQYTKSS